MQDDKEFLEDYKNRHRKHNSRKKRFRFPVVPVGNIDNLIKYFKGD